VVGFGTGGGGVGGCGFAPKRFWKNSMIAFNRDITTKLLARLVWNHGTFSA
jgi:hypothetical protein